MTKGGSRHPIRETPRDSASAMRVGPALLLIAISLGGFTVAIAELRQTPPSSAPTSTPASAPALGPVAELRNVHTIRPGVLICGGQPDGPGAFAELAAMGVKTIVSVDGVTPDVEAARRAGMSYVHIPLGYDGVPDRERLRLARAARELRWPVYVHCHHGKHRGPAAAATAAVTLGWWTHEQAISFLKTAGTSEHYAGLYAGVREAATASPEELLTAEDPLKYPERARVSERVAWMVIADEALENLKRIEAAGWKTPADHPDLVPAAEAARLAEQFRMMRAAERPSHSNYFNLLWVAAAETGKLEASLAPKAAASIPSAARLSKQLAGVVASCVACHEEHRR